MAMAKFQGAPPKGLGNFSTDVGYCWSRGGTGRWNHQGSLRMGIALKQFSGLQIFVASHRCLPWSKSQGGPLKVQLASNGELAVGLQGRKRRVAILRRSGQEDRLYHPHQSRISATDSSSSSSSSFPGSSGVDANEAHYSSDHNFGSSVSQSDQGKSTGEDQRIHDDQVEICYDVDALLDSEFSKRDHRSLGSLNGAPESNGGEDGALLLSENGAQSSDDSWERYSEDSSGGGESSSSNSSSAASLGSPSVGAKEPVYEVIEVDPQGKALKKLVSRRQLLRSSGLRLRDLRRVDPSLWVTNSAPALLVRDHAILLNLGSLRAIATSQVVLIFDHQSVGAQGFLETLLPILSADKNNGGPTLMPFELEVVEAALISRTQRLERALLAVEPRVVALLEVLPTRLTADVLEELRVSKQALVEVGAKGGALRQMLLELLEHPQDIRRMTVMGRVCSIRKEDGEVQCAVPQDKQVAEDEEEEMEMLLEYYLQRCESCHGQVEKLLSAAKEMEDSLAVNLSSRRLEVSRLELLLQVGTFCAALGALVAGIFGMNLKSYLEERVMAFWFTTACIILGGMALYIYIVSYLKNRKIL